ncbi:amino acid adenylation domain-containing protein [Bradyrhizobium sp. LB1.3]
MRQHFDGTQNIALEFVNQARINPEAIAIVCENETINYGDLLALASTNASLLRNLAQCKSGPVAILGTRSVETPLAMLSCLLAKLPFVILDTAYPKERILDILRISSAAVCFYPSSLATGRDSQFRTKAGAIAWLEIAKMRTQDPTNLVDPAGLSVTPDDVAYLLFTSGSTGFPKGILTGHAPIVHFIRWYENVFGPRPGSKFSMLSGLSHDPLLRDVLVPLSLGGELHIPKQCDLLAPDRLFNWLDSSHIEYAHLTPPLIDLLSARKRKDEIQRLRYVFCGGDVLRGATVKHVRELAPRAHLVNFYGTSETPQAMTYQIIGPELSAPYPLGKPISDVKVWIVDEDLNNLEVGTQGEIAIETEYLSFGYIGHDHRQDEGGRRNAFLQRGATPDSRDRMYLTGDLGYADQEGRIYFCGRRDDQVKVRGYRVDCIEIAAVFERHGLVKRAIVLPEASESGDTILVAYVVGNDGGVRRFAPDLLPSYMIPSLVVSVDQLPLLPNGKVDRSALRSIGQSRIAAAAIKNVTDSQFLREVSDAWGGIEFDGDQSFVELGGDSLSYVRMSLLIEDRLGFLPVNWEEIPFVKLASMEIISASVQREAGLFSLVSVEASLLFRAISITLVVLDHARVGFFTATSTLFLVSGMSFGRFLLPGILESGRLLPTLGFITKFAVPAAIWQLFRGDPAHHIWLPDIFLMGTLFANPDEGSLPFWFLDILAASLLIFAAIGKVYYWSKHLLGRAEQEGKVTFAFCVSAFFVGLSALFLQTQLDWWNGEINHTSVGPFRWFWLLPLGAAIYFARSTYEKLLLTAITGALVVAAYGNLVVAGSFMQPFSAFLFLSIVIMIWFGRIVLPRILRGSFAVLAQHSLFIYMLSGWVANKLMPKLAVVGIPDLLVLRVCLAVACGVAASVVWNDLADRVLGVIGRKRIALTGLRGWPLRRRDSREASGESNS